MAPPRGFSIMRKMRQIILCPCRASSIESQYYVCHSLCSFNFRYLILHKKNNMYVKGCAVSMLLWSNTVWIQNGYKLWNASQASQCEMLHKLWNAYKVKYFKLWKTRIKPEKAEDIQQVRWHCRCQWCRNIFEKVSQVLRGGEKGKGKKS